MFWYKMTTGNPGSRLLALIVFAALGSSAALADFTFGKPVNLTSAIPVLDPIYDTPFCFSADGLEMYIGSCRPGTYGAFDTWVLRRKSQEADWGAPEHLGPPVNTPDQPGAGPCNLSANGLELYFYTIRPEGNGDFDLYVAARTTQNDPWVNAVNLGPKVNSSSLETFSWISADSLELYFLSNRPGGLGGLDIYVSRRATAKEAWGDPQNLGPMVNSDYDEGGPSLSPDGLLLFFQDVGGSVPRPGGYGGGDLWMTRRASLSAPWGPPVNLGPNVNGPNFESVPRVSPDGAWLYWCTANDDWTVWDNWRAPIIPTVDFNGDKKVDLVDLVMMIDDWGTNRPLCDIGPMPWGDGKVDIEDLKVFMTYYEKANPPVKP